MNRLITQMKTIRMNCLDNKKTNKIITSIFLVLCLTLSSYAINPIESIAEETFVIYVFDNKTKKITNIFLYDVAIENKGAQLIDRFENSSFFTGIVKGDFKENKGEILLKRDCMFLILRDNSKLYNKDIPSFSKKDQYPGSDVFIPVKEFIPGDMFIILFDSFESKIKVEVMKNDINETVLKVL